MFLQYFAVGAILPILSLYLKDYRGFTGTQVGTIMALNAVAVLVSLFVAAFIADRIIKAETLFSICHFAAAALILLFSLQKTFIAAAATYLLYTIVMGPTVPLTNSITFHHSPDRQKNFSIVRLWGTIGWIVVAFAFSFCWLKFAPEGKTNQRLPHAFILSAITSLTLAIYTCFIPRTDIKLEKPKTLIPIEAISVFLKPSIIFIAAISLLIGIVDKYYYFAMAPYLKHIGFNESSIMPFMSAGQTVEVFAMIAIGSILTKIGYKKAMLIGIAAEAWRFTAFAIGSPAIIFSGILCHGIAYTFFFTCVFIYIDSHSDKKSRTGLHQLFNIITAGIVSLLGNLIAGFFADILNIANSPKAYTAYWLIPATISLICFFAMLLFFKEKNLPINKNTAVR